MQKPIACVVVMAALAGSAARAQDAQVAAADRAAGEFNPDSKATAG